MKECFGVEFKVIVWVGDLVVVINVVVEEIGVDLLVMGVYWYMLLCDLFIGIILEWVVCNVKILVLCVVGVLEEEYCWVLLVLDFLLILMCVV